MTLGTLWILSVSTKISCPDNLRIIHDCLFKGVAFPLYHITTRCFTFRQFCRTVKGCAYACSLTSNTLAVALPQCPLFTVNVQGLKSLSSYGGAGFRFVIQNFFISDSFFNIFSSSYKKNIIKSKQNTHFDWRRAAPADSLPFGLQNTTRHPVFSLTRYSPQIKLLCL